MTPRRLVIVDDNPMLLTALKEWLTHIPSLVVVGDTQDGQQAGRLCQRLKPDVLLLGLTVVGASPPEIVRLVRAQSPKTRIIILASYVGTVHWSDIADQVDGYLVKSDAPATICRAIRPMGSRVDGQRTA